MLTYLDVAVAAARKAGDIQLAGLHTALHVREETLHDIKLQTDVDCEDAIREMLLGAFPDTSILAEEGGGEIAADVPTWIVDPLDGTVNYSRRIPFFCVSIALQVAGCETVGVVYAPVFDELFVAEIGKGATLNGAPIHVSDVPGMPEAMVAVGCGKSNATIHPLVAHVTDLAHRARKIRIFGAAALDMAYVAMGRLDGFIEGSLRTWDIAAGGLLIREAGGRTEIASVGEHAWDVRVDNGRLW